MSANVWVIKRLVQIRSGHGKFLDTGDGACWGRNGDRTGRRGSGHASDDPVIRLDAETGRNAIKRYACGASEITTLDGDTGAGKTATRAETADGWAGEIVVGNPAAADAKAGRKTENRPAARLLQQDFSATVMRRGADAFRDTAGLQINLETLRRVESKSPGPERDAINGNRRSRYAAADERKLVDRECG